MPTKVVITGGACSGKSSIITELEKRGFIVLKEVAKEIHNRRKNFILINEEHFKRQKIIFDTQLNNEINAKKNYRQKIVFLDRSLIDAIFYFDFFNWQFPKAVSSINLKNKYDFVFSLEQLSFKKQGFRIEEDEEEAKRIHVALLNYYKNLGYNLIHVPIMNINDRIEFILDKIGVK